MALVSKYAVLTFISFSSHTVCVCAMSYNIDHSFHAQKVHLTSASKMKSNVASAILPPCSLCLKASVCNTGDGILYVQVLEQSKTLWG